MQQTMERATGGWEVGADGLVQVLGVDLDLDEDVERAQGGLVDGYQTGVAVVDEEVGAEGEGGERVDAAGAVGDVAEDDGLDRPGRETREQVGDGRAVDEQALGHLQRDRAGLVSLDRGKGFRDLEGIV